MCECTTKNIHPDEFMAEYCTSCGMIWVNMITGGSRPTDRFHKLPKPMNGVWVGHTFVRGPKPLLKSLGACS